MNHAFHNLVTAASRAPSGDNTQPWQFEVDEQAGRLTIALNPSRDPSPMNAGQRMARIACGAALENIARTLNFNDWRAGITLDPSGYSASVQLYSAAESQAEIEHVISNRCSNRKFYSNEPVPKRIRDVLSMTNSGSDEISIHWLWETDALKSFAALESAAFSTLYGKRRIRAAILDNVRFDRPRTEKVNAGLSLGSLELSALESKLFRLTGRLPDWMVKGGGILMGMSHHVRKLVLSSSALCLITAKRVSPHMDWQVGRAAQKAWLALTEQGLAAQPMMTLPVLEQISRHSKLDSQGLPESRHVQALLDRWPEVLPQAKDQHVAFVLRAGYATQPTARTGREPISFLVNKNKQVATVQS